MMITIFCLDSVNIQLDFDNSKGFVKIRCCSSCDYRYNFVLMIASNIEVALVVNRRGL